MATERDEQQLENLVGQIEDYISRGISSPARQEEIQAMINLAEAIFDKIVSGYIDNPEKPSFVSAYNVSELQERLHHAGDSLAALTPATETPGGGTDRQLTIYTMPGCPWCRRTKEYLAQKGIAYTEYDIARDRAKADEMVEKSGQTGVPVIIIGGELVVGFDRTRLDSLLS